MGLWLVLATVLHGVAILVTAFRLWIRYKRHSLWWDDGWAFVALMCIIILLATNWLHTVDTGADFGLEQEIYAADFFLHHSVDFSTREGRGILLVRFLNFGERHYS